MQHVVNVFTASLRALILPLRVCWKRQALFMPTRLVVRRMSRVQLQIFC